MVRDGDQAWDYVQWDNKFLHSLGTVTIAVVGVGLGVGILLGIYWSFRRYWHGWGRLLTVPWLLISSVMYWVILVRVHFPETNPDPQETAEFLSLLAGAVAMYAFLWTGEALLDWARRKA
jgi:fatty acid desaturase